MAHSMSNKEISILGSSGSIGRSTIDLLERNPEKFQVKALTAHSNVQQLIKQCLSVQPKLAVIGDTKLYQELKEGLSGTQIEIAAGEEAIIHAAQYPCDMVVAAIVGTAGLKPTLAAINCGRTIGLANKESLVAAGNLMIDSAKKTNAKLLPVDSEHNALFQVFETKNRDFIEKLILTASGGPFLHFKKEEMVDITPEQAIKHPNWSMGAKISVDSATMVNKALEIVEACYLFSMPESQIDVVMHPESIIHSLVAYKDGSVLAQLGMPDMRVPIANVLAWPERIETPVARLSLSQIGKLTFFEPNPDQWPILSIIREALRNNKGETIVINAANEIAVQAFLEKKINFLDIITVIQETLICVNSELPETIDHVIALDQQARIMAKKLIEEKF